MPTTTTALVSVTPPPNSPILLKKNSSFIPTLISSSQPLQRSLRVSSRSGTNTILFRYSFFVSNFSVLFIMSNHTFVFSLLFLIRSSLVISSLGLWFKLNKFLSITEIMKMKMKLVLCAYRAVPWWTLQIWILPQVKASFTRCTVVKLFTWFVPTLALCIGVCYVLFQYYSVLIQTCMQVRHAQGFHNVEGDKNPDAYLSYDLFDASLTPLGWNQVIAMLFRLSQ